LRNSKPAKTDRGESLVYTPDLDYNLRNSSKTDIQPGRTTAGEGNSHTPRSKDAHSLLEESEAKNRSLTE